MKMRETEMELAETPGEALQAAREAAGLTQTQLAERMQRNPHRVSELEADKRRITLEWALDLEAVKGLKHTAEDWLVLQITHDLERARRLRERRGGERPPR